MTQNFEYCSNFPDRIPRIVAAAIRSLARSHRRERGCDCEPRVEKRERRMTERTGGERTLEGVAYHRPLVYMGNGILLFPFLSFSLSAREIDFPLIPPRPRTRPHGPISPGDTMNKKFTESRARCSNTAQRPMSIYGIGEREREKKKRKGGRRGGRGKRETGDFVRSDVGSCSMLSSRSVLYIT